MTRQRQLAHCPDQERHQPEDRDFHKDLPARRSAQQHSRWENREILHEGQAEIDRQPRDQQRQIDSVVARAAETGAIARMPLDGDDWTLHQELAR